MKAEENPVEAEVSNKIKCNGCGANLTFTPGTSTLDCQYCGAKNKIEVQHTHIEEIDLNKFLSENQPEESLHEINLVNCQNCGASTTLKPDVTSDTCPFCATPLIIKMPHQQNWLSPGIYFLLRSNVKPLPVRILSGLANCGLRLTT
jgi:LSD1 subclass zinc finger protein